MSKRTENWATVDLNRLSAAAILDGLRTRFVGQNVVYRSEIDSTSDEAKRLAAKGAPEGTLVIADYQSKGRGRLDRGWVAPPGTGLLMSIIFRPHLAARGVQSLTMSCSLAVVDAIESETGLQADLKWPNDVVIAGRKVGGILTEIEIEGAEVGLAVVGIGLNINLDLDLLPADLPVTATSLSHEAGTEVARLPLLQTLLQRVEERYAALRAGKSPRREWAERLVTIGSAVTVLGNGSQLEGVAEGVDEDGALLVRLADGGLETVRAGDVFSWGLRLS